MSVFRSPNTKRMLSRLFCSLTWVISYCWPEIPWLFVVVISSWSIYIGGFILLAIITLIALAFLHWLLLRWTARVYPTEESPRNRLLLQTCLVVLSMLIIYISDQTGGYYHPMGFSTLNPLEPTQQIGIVSYFSYYGNSWLCIVILQYIAIRDSKFFLKPLRKKQDEESVDDNIP